MAKRGTTAKIDMGELEKLSMMQATDEEISAWFGVTTRTWITPVRGKGKRILPEVEKGDGKAMGRDSAQMSTGDSK